MEEMAEEKNIVAKEVPLELRSKEGKVHVPGGKGSGKRKGWACS